MPPSPAAHGASSARPEGLLDLSPIGTIKYMGSKRALVPVLAHELAGLCQPETPLLDLFAGTHAVGYSMRQRNPVVAVDAQEYSGVIGRALLRDRLDLTADEVVARLTPHLQSNTAAAEEIFRRQMATERRVLARLKRDDTAAVDDYKAFQISLPDPSSWSGAGTRSSRLDRQLREAVEARRAEPGLFPYLMLSAYYANAYFGLEQAIILDGLRYAIDAEFPDGAGRDICLAALLSAASNVTSTPGHFAMWRLIRTAVAAHDVARFRERDALMYFRTKLTDLVASQTGQPERHRVHVSDAAAFIRTFDGPVGVVYLDPPYSAVHYSRFYHVLEELVTYDYPEVYFMGRFPSDRYTSAWSVRTRAAQAFEELLESVARRGWPTLISYGSRGIVPEATLVRLCQKAFGNPGVDVRQVRTRHASMGRADRGSRPTRELLIACTPRRPGSRRVLQSSDSTSSRPASDST